ncbi:MAG: hypothetical protein GIKADHBN_02705 [Phycisphaerales bacterium]|nr:hypothetical protein [Phycisphaerales bacterium]
MSKFMQFFSYALGTGLAASLCSAQVCSEINKLVPAWTASGDIVGRELVSDGQTMLVGAVGHDGAVSNSGLVAVYELQASSWTYAQAVAPPAEAASSGFGDGLAVCGEWALVGSPATGTGNPGSVHAYKRSGGAWTFVQSITSPTPAADDRFGLRVAIECNRAVVAASGEDGQRGAVYVLQRTGDVWSIESRLSPGDANPGDILGTFGVAIDRDTVLATAAHHDSEGTNSGAVYAFERDDTGAWGFRQKILANDPTPEATFGSSLSMDNGRIAVGSNGVDAAYVFERSTCDGLWVQTHRIDSGFLGGGKFGDYLSMKGDILVVGVPTFDGLAGRADVLLRDPLTNTWARMTTLLPSDGAPGDQFGYGLCVLGGRVLAGAHRADAPGLDGGAVYEFDLDLCRCPSDFDKSGFTDTDDFDAFVRAFEAGC